MIEPDIDYYKDLAAHALLEVITNKLTHSLTTRAKCTSCGGSRAAMARIPNFEPPYTIE